MSMQNLARVAAQHICNDVRPHDVRIVTFDCFRVAGALFAMVMALTNPVQSQQRTVDAALDALLRSQRCVSAPAPVELSADATSLLDELETCVLVSSAIARLPQVLTDYISWTEAFRVRRITVELVNSYGWRLPLDSAGTQFEHLLAGSEWHVRIELDRPEGSVWVMFDRLAGDIRSEWRGVG